MLGTIILGLASAGALVLAGRAHGGPRSSPMG
jgi:hypothetical protein